MATPVLELRRRKLLHMLLHAEGMVSGETLAAALKTSSRTVRSDVVAINETFAQLEGVTAQITSQRGRGYRLQTQSPAAIAQLVQGEISMNTRTDRQRYLAFRLCLSDTPLSLDDLEDTLFVSRTTLESDLKALRETYSEGAPYISLHMRAGMAALESDECKRRRLLVALYAEEWNYHGTTNAIYRSDYLDETLLAAVMDLVSRDLADLDLQMEDTDRIHLNLACTIMLERLAEGYALPEIAPQTPADPKARVVAWQLADHLATLGGHPIPLAEREELCQMITWGKRIDMTKLRLATVSRFFDAEVIQMTGEYLDALEAACAVDFRRDEDFYFTLLQVIRYLQSPFHVFPHDIPMPAGPECTLASYFQAIATRHARPPLGAAELAHLATCVSGAVEFLAHFHPEHKLRTVICCHMHLSVTWTLKRKILAHFRRYLLVTDLLPVNAADFFDFSQTDLVLTTVQKPIANLAGVRTLQISPQVSPEDIANLEQLIHEQLWERLLVQRT